MSFAVNLKQIVQNYDLLLLVSFGSYGTDRFTERSDIDLAYLSRRSLDGQDKVALLGDLVRLFSRDGVDVVDLSHANPLLMYEIACKSQLLHEEDDSYLKFKLKASARYADTKFLREQRRNYLNDVLKEGE